MESGEWEAQVFCRTGVSKSGAWLDERLFRRSASFLLAGRDVREGANKKISNQRGAADDCDGAGENRMQECCRGDAYSKSEECPGKTHNGSFVEQLVLVVFISLK